MDKKIIGAIAVAVLMTIGLASCEGETKAPAESPAAVVPDGDANAPAQEPVEDAAVEGTIPDFTGMSHQDAQDTAQSIGFYNLHEEDASGMSRFLFNDSNWTVCSQTPEPGVYFTDADITLYSVKVDEVCP